MPKDRIDRFFQSIFSMILIDEHGHIVGEINEFITESFSQTMIVKNAMCRSGKYTLIVDTNWEEMTLNDPDYKKVNLRIFTGEKFGISSIEKSKGLSVLRDALKLFAVSAKNKE